MSTPRPLRRTPRVVLGAMLVASTLALGACSSDDDDDDDMDTPDVVDTTDMDGDADSDADSDADQTSMLAPDSGEPVDMSPITYTIPLTVEEEIPAPTGVPEGATGTATLVFDPTTRGITGSITTSGLSGPPDAAHIHEQGFADDGTLQETGPVIVPFGPDGSGTGFVLADDVILTEEQAESLETGLLYVNVHTAQNPAGEVRGQIVLDDEDDGEDDGEDGDTDS